MFEGENRNPSSRLGWLGLIVSVVYFGLLVFLLWNKTSEFQNLELNEMGDFFAGMLGPLAIFWLVLGFFQQGKELRHSVDALRLQAEELRASVAQQKSMVEVALSQLTLDVEVREEQTRLFISNELPLFQLEPRGGMGQGTGQMALIFLLRNVGADATTYTITVDGGDGEFPDREMNFLQTGQHYEFSLLRKDSTKTDIAIWANVTISSKNKRNWSRTQTFAISSGQLVTQISIDPPTN